MKLILLFFKAAWIGVYGAFSNLTNPTFIVCSYCNKVLHAPKKAKAISRGCCWLCHYKQLGGKFPRFPKASDFAIYARLFKKTAVVHDAVWSGQMIYNGLLENGKIFRSARDERRSLDDRE